MIPKSNKWDCDSQLSIAVTMVSVYDFLSLLSLSQWQGNTSWWGVCDRGGLFASWKKGSKKREMKWLGSLYALQAHTPNDLSSFY
jgi:hypothetical protein